MSIVNEKAKLMAKAEKAIEEYLKKKEKTIDQDIHHALDRQVNNLIAKYMGFDDRWGRWELSSSSNSDAPGAMTFIRNAVQHNAPLWLSDQVGKLPALPKAAIADLKRVYIDRLERGIRERLYDKAGKDAIEIADSILAELQLKDTTTKP